jgi:hypothetical protein
MLTASESFPPCFADWYEGLVTETLIETFRDYFGDIERYAAL